MTNLMTTHTLLILFGQNWTPSLIHSLSLAESVNALNHRYLSSPSLMAAYIHRLSHEGALNPSLMEIRPHRLPHEGALCLPTKLLFMAQPLITLL